MITNIDETIRLVDLLLEQEISADQFQRLNNLIEQDADARNVYIQLVHMHLQLPDVVLRRYADKPSATGLTGNEVRQFPRAVGLVVLAATVLLAIGWFAFSKESDSPHDPTNLTAARLEEAPESIDPNVAVVTAAIDVVWADSAALGPGDGAAPGILKIDSGVLRLEFYCGAAVLLEGPAELELKSSTVAVLSSGRLRAHVPPEARGFTILSPQVKLVDQGTEFGVVALDNGETQVHVFDGLVDLYPGHDARRRSQASTEAKGSHAQQLSSGEAVLLAADGEQQIIEVEADDFISFQQFSQMVADATQQRHRSWLRWKHSFKNGPRVQAWFDFSPELISHRRIHGLVPESDPLTGTLVGCSMADGRWPGESSLEFKHPGDRVRVSLPIELEAMTLMAWVRIDGLDRSFNGLLMSDDHGTGRPHWQINRRGEIVFSIREMRGLHNYKSDAVIDDFAFGRWIHLTTVYDPHNKVVKHYVNGVLAGSKDIARPVALRFGKTEIGNWRNVLEKTRTPIRALNGRVDELIIFRGVLTEDEIQRIHKLGSSAPVG